MSRTLNPDPRLECQLWRDGTQSFTSRESAITPVEHSLTAFQACSQWLLLQEPTGEMAQDPALEEVEHILESFDEPSGHSHKTTQNPHSDTSGLDL